MCGDTSGCIDNALCLNIFDKILFKLLHIIFLIYPEFIVRLGRLCPRLLNGCTESVFGVGTLLPDLFIVGDLAPGQGGFVPSLGECSWLRGGIPSSLDNDVVRRSCSIDTFRLVGFRLDMLSFISTDPL